MLTYKDYENKFNKPDVTKNKYRYFAYKNGEVREFDTLEHALMFSSNIEKFHCNKEEMDTYSQAIREYSNNVYNAWLLDLREEYSELSDEQFKLCFDFDFAFNTSYTCNYDEGVSYMEDVVMLAKKLLKLK